MSVMTNTSQTRKVIGLAIAFLLGFCAIVGAVSAAPGAAELESLPRLPGGVLLGGLADSPEIAVAAEDATLPDDLNDLAHVLGIAIDAAAIAYEVWQAGGVDIEVTRISGTRHVEAAAVRVRSNEEAVTLQLWGSNAAVDGHVVGIQPHSGVRTVTFFPATGSPLAVAAGEPTSVTRDGVEVALQPVDIELASGSEVLFLLVATELWEAGHGVQLGQNLAAALSGEVALARLVISGSADRAEVRPGDRLRYTLLQGNVGAAPSADVNTSLPIPPQIQIDAGSLTVSAGDVEYDADTQRITWTVENVPVGAVLELSYEALVR